MALRRRSFASAAATALGLALCAYPVTLSAAPSSRSEAEASYTFAFEDALISQVAQEILGELGLRYSVDPSVTGRMSFRIDQRLTKAQLLQAFEATLAANNVALVRQGDGLLVTATAKARTAAGPRPLADGSHAVGYEVVAVPLTYATPTEVAKALEAIAGTGSVVYADDKLGLILLSGSGRELQSELETVKVFDQSALQGSKIRWFELSQAPAEMVASELGEVLKGAGVGGVSIAPLKRLNGLVVFGRSATALDQVGQWIYRLDAPTKDVASSLWVYHPRNTTAEALSKTLNSVVSGQIASEQLPSPAAMRQPAVAHEGGPAEAVTVLPAAGGDDVVRAAVDRETNTLLISAPAWRWTKIQKILEEIDRPQAQLLIEARILEVTLSNDFRLGVDWSVLGRTGPSRITQSQNDNGAIAPLFPGFSITFLDNDIQAAVNALGGRTAVEVISAPKVITLDNHAARLEVGDQVPIVTQRSQSTVGVGSPVINTIDYRNSGVILNVTPRISGEDRVVLDVEQEVSSAVKTVSSNIDSPTIQQRKIASTLVLHDGGVVALGGLISRTRDQGDSGIPGLKDIPGLGNLFKSSNRDDKRTELIVLLSAKILHDAPGAERATADLLADMREIRGRGLLNVSR
jgi:general secretion pathway protein D